MKHKNSKIVITGGHLTPALALIEILQKKNWDIHYFGRTYAMQHDTKPSLESQLIPSKKIHFYSLNTGRFRRHIDLENIIDTSKIIIGILHALILLKKIKPKIIISFGGYLGLPTVIAGWILKIPTIIHEQISVSGLANKISANFATKIAITFPSSQKYYPKNKTTLTGNPIQPGIFVQNKTIAKKYTKNFKPNPTILITCGNQGSKSINQVILKCLPTLLKKYNIIHQIGPVEAQNEEWDKSQKNTAKQYKPVRFIPHSDMGTIYSISDLVICRAGANTIFELGALQKPAITIPLPHSLMNEQLKNAQLFQTAGLGTLIKQIELQPENLIKQIDNIFKHKQKYKLKKSYQKTFPKNGAHNLYKLITQTINS